MLDSKPLPVDFSFLAICPNLSRDKDDKFQEQDFELMTLEGMGPLLHFGPYSIN